MGTKCFIAVFSVELLAYQFKFQWSALQIGQVSSIYIYIITQVILAFGLVLAYDLLEDRCTIDVIITKFLPLPF